MDIRQVVHIVDSGNWFSCHYFTSDEHKATGGKYNILPRVRLSRRHVMAERRKAVPAIATARNAKAQNHHYHFTRNLETPNGQIIKVHPLLIETINGKKTV
jgi:hypothetical protein